MRWRIYAEVKSEIPLLQKHLTLQVLPHGEDLGGVKQETRNKKPETRNQKLFKLFNLLPCKKNKS
jgi:hypothetical protein